MKALMTVGSAVTLLGIAPSSWAQKNPIPYRYQFAVEGLSADSVYLANYYGDKMFYADTAVADSKGRFSFDGVPYEKCGKFAVILPGQKMFEFLGVQENVNIRTQVNNPSESVLVLESKENQVFYDYLRFIQTQRKKGAPYEAVLSDSTSTPEAIEQARNAMNALGEEVKAHQLKLLQSSPDLLFCKYLNMVVEPELPEVPSSIVNRDEMLYRMYRQVYWNRVDFSDPRLVHDGSFQQILNTYFTRVLPQAPDTVLAESIRLIELARNNEEMFKYITHYATFQAESSKIMCMDKVFVELVNRYYRTGMATWLKPEQLKKITDRADDLAPALCDQKVPNIILPGVDQTQWKALYDLEAKYTVLLIWESTCGHCKKEMPKLEALYREWEPRGLKFYAIGNDFEPEPWLKYLNEHPELADWTHVTDNPQVNQQDSAMKLLSARVTNLQSLNFRTTFDVFATPKLFLLDADKRVIAKQIGAEQLAEILARLEGLPLPDPTSPIYLQEEEED
jgi:thiol-disulfide isomerase/thioredoxin